MRVYQRGRWFWVEYVDALGRRTRESLKTRDHSEALKKMHEIGLGVKQGNTLLGDEAQVLVMIERYLEEDHGHRPSTRERITRCLENVCQVLGSASITDLDFRQRVKAYREERSRQGAAPRTINKEVGLLKQVISHSIEDSPGMVNPLHGLKQRRVPHKETRGLTTAEIAKVFSVLRTPEERLRFGLYALTGMRRGEGIHLRWVSVDLDARVIRVEPFEDWQPKTGEPRLIPVCSQLDEILKEAPRRSMYVLVTKRGKPFFADHGNPLLRWFKKLFKRAGLRNPEELNIHSLRHGYVSRLAQMGIRAELRAKLVGHRSLSMHRDVYTHAEITEALEAGRRLSYA